MLSITKTSKNKFLNAFPGFLRQKSWKILPFQCKSEKNRKILAKHPALFRTKFLNAFPRFEGASRETPACFTLIFLAADRAAIWGVLLPPLGAGKHAAELG